jgi:hypothetical protein
MDLKWSNLIVAFASLMAGIAMLRWREPVAVVLQRLLIQFHNPPKWMESAPAPRIESLKKLAVVFGVTFIVDALLILALFGRD